MSVDTVAVVGAGPAGMAAAAEAGHAGADVILIDAAPRWGGQYWRHGSTGPAADLHHDIAVFTGLERDLAALACAGRLQHAANHHVWSVAADDAGCRIHTIDRTDPNRPVEATIEADRLVLATGAYDRAVPFPGWQLPGVMTAGAVQALLKEHGVLAGRRILLAGTGPFLLPVAAGCAARGGTVVAVHEANHPGRWLRHPGALTGAAAKLGEAAGYAAALARHRIPLRHRSVVVAAHGTDRLERVTLARLDRHGQIRPETRHDVATDVLAVGYGFAIQSELPRQAGCALDTTAEQTLAVRTDHTQRTSNPRVFAAGESTGVGGAQLAVVEGRIAGRCAAGAPVVDRRLARKRDRLRRFAAAMHAVYPVPAAWLTGLEPDTAICRCEEVTVADIDAALALGARDTRTVKLLSRAGMGWCQGRVCGFATGCLVAHRTGQPLDLNNGADRPVAAPVPLGVLAGPTTQG
jgi:NADPH-dependent 2,4-dienoyl-CoA reductase/sulfur reductase-like enzyme